MSLALRGLRSLTGKSPEAYYGDEEIDRLAALDARVPFIAVVRFYGEGKGVGAGEGAGPVAVGP